MLICLKKLKNSQETSSAGAGLCGVGVGAVGGGWCCGCGLGAGVVIDRFHCTYFQSVAQEFGVSQGSSFVNRFKYQGPQTNIIQ